MYPPRNPASCFKKGYDKSKREIPPRQNDPLLDEKVEMGYTPIWFAISVSILLATIVIVLLIKL